jgi:hypothetical protein
MQAFFDVYHRLLKIMLTVPMTALIVPVSMQITAPRSPISSMLWRLDAPHPRADARCLTCIG